MPQRLVELHRHLTEIYFSIAPKGAVEKLFFQRNVRTAISVGRAGCTLLALLRLTWMWPNILP
jgi:Holliday junction resolvasome RuvABC endonuclease subunit